MCTAFLVNETLSTGRGWAYFRSFFVTAFHPRGISQRRHVDFLAFSTPLMDCS